MESGISSTRQVGSYDGLRSAELIAALASPFSRSSECNSEAEALFFPVPTIPGVRNVTIGTEKDRDPMIHQSDVTSQMFISLICWNYQ
jgi:hypothetical protein